MIGSSRRVCGKRETPGVDVGETERDFRTDPHRNKHTYTLLCT